MMQSSTKVFAARRHCFRNEIHALLPYFCLAVLLLAVLPAWGGKFSPGRMVYVNGQLHDVWIRGNDDYVYHQTGHPADPINGTGAYTIATDADGVQIPNQRGPYICRYYTMASSEGLAVFYNKIYLIYTRDTDCGYGSRGDMSAYVVAFDLLPTDTQPYGHWLAPYKLGPVHVKSASGAAITVFNGQLYAFTDTDTYTSGDGVHWTPHFKPLNDANHQPMDAVTIYPVNGPPKILLVYGGATSNGNYFDGVYAATWNGDFNSSRTDYPGNPIIGKWVAGRVSLLPGTKKAAAGVDGSVSGDLVLSVQLFAQLMDSNTMRNLEYHVNENTWVKKDTQDYAGFTNLVIYPWYATACDTTHKNFQARKQRLLAYGSGTVRPEFDSDYMVPKNGETTTECGIAPGHKNTTDPSTETTRKYWSLIGIVAGSPPFSLNGATNAKEVQDISNVIYGSTTGTGTEHSQQWTHQSMISSGIEVHAGLFDGLLNITNSFDVTYKHDWESTHKTTTDRSVAQETRMGTMYYSEGIFQPVPYSSCTTNADCAQHADPYAADNSPACQLYHSELSPPQWKSCAAGETGCVCTVTPTGKTGWALFNAPTLYVQDYAVYAYNYDFHTGIGTDLNQDLHTVEAKGFSIVPVTFDLQHPEAVGQVKNPDGSIKIPGILQGMQPFPYSTDFLGWSRQNWDRVDQPWWIKLGPSTSPNVGTVTFDTGVNQGQTYTENQTTVDGTAQTTSNEIRNETGVEFGTGLAGFKAHLTVGNDSGFSTSVSTQTSFEKDLKADLGMPNCTVGTLGCVSQLTTQPYLLVATGKAPWIPDLYPVTEGKDGPWCITWTVTKRCPGGPGCGVTMVRLSPLGLPPLNAFGRIVSGKGGGAQGQDLYSHYSIVGGRLAWRDSQGTEERIPMTADDFVPSEGVTLEVNGLSWSPSGGSWKRSGNIWTFQTDPKVEQNRLTLNLDFGSASYDLQIQKADFSGHVFAGMTDIVLRLGVNGKYTFSTTIHHDVDIRWEWSQPPANDVAMHVTSLEGRYNSANQSGKISMSGILPKDLPAFGDVSIVINGNETTIPLLAMDNFQQAVQTGGVLKYAREGLILVVDFGNKTWSATLNNKAFNRLLGPRFGKIRAKVLVGGIPAVTSEDAVMDYSAILTLRH